MSFFFIRTQNIIRVFTRRDLWVSTTTARPSELSGRRRQSARRGVYRNVHRRYVAKTVVRLYTARRDATTGDVPSRPEAFSDIRSKRKAEPEKRQNAVELGSRVEFGITV